MPLRRKLLLGLFLLVSTLAVGIGLTISIHEVASQRVHAQKTVRSLSVALASEIARQVMWDDHIAMHKVLSEIVRSYPEVEYALVMRGEKPLVHTFTRGVPRGLLLHARDGKGGRRWTFRDAGGEVFHDISTAMPRVGASLHVGLSEDAVDRGLTPLLLRIAVLVLAVIFFGAGLSAVFARWATREVDRLTADLRASKEFLQSVMDSMPFPLMVIGKQFEVLHANRAMEDHVGGSFSGVPAPRCFAFLHDRETPCDVCPHATVLATGAPVTIEQSRCCGEQAEQVFELSASPLFDHEGQVESVIKTIHDITERKKTEQNRLRRVKLEGVLEMAGAACHEVGQPLQSLMNLASMLQRQTDEDDPRREKVDRTMAEVHRLGEMVHRIMRITRYEPLEYTQGVTIVDIEKSSTP